MYDKSHRSLLEMKDIKRKMNLMQSRKSSEEVDCALYEDE